MCCPKRANSLADTRLFGKKDPVHRRLDWQQRVQKQWRFVPVSSAAMAQMQMSELAMAEWARTTPQVWLPRQAKARRHCLAPDPAPQTAARLQHRCRLPRPTRPAPPASPPAAVP